MIEQVRRLVGDNITDEAAVFYLEMNQFNVAAAVGSYFDLEAGAEAKASPPQMMFVRDVTIGEGESVPPNTMFIKTWQVRILKVLYLLEKIWARVQTSYYLPRKGQHMQYIYIPSTDDIKISSSICTQR